MRASTLAAPIDRPPRRGDARAGTAPQEIVYEVECLLDPEIVPDFDAWLPGHVDMVLASPGFLGAELLRPTEPAADGRVRRINRYRVKDRGALDHYLEQLAPALREDGARRFGDRASYQRRVLASVETHLPRGAAETCANCGARLAGPWCAQCGQHARESARSLGTLFHDAWHVFTHVDGRLWSTLRGLMLKPGFLTAEYFREHRARYIPPFRLYLVLSLVFFGLAAVTDSVHVGGADAAAPAGDERGRLEAEARGIANARRELAAGVGADGPAATAGAAVDAALARRERELAAALAGEAAAPATIAGSGLSHFDGADCTRLDVEPQLLEAPLRRACERAARDGGASLGRAFLANVPKTMFVFLPLIAAAMLLLYWRPRRYYVEHLVFYLHVHAALFLAFTVLVLVGALGRVLPPVDTVVPVLALATVCYGAWYVWRAMRVYYGNGRAATFAKGAVVGVFYLTFSALTLVGAALVAALTT